MFVKKSLSKGAKIGIGAASIFTLGAVAILTIWGVKKHLNKKNFDPNQSEDNNLKLIDQSNVENGKENIEPLQNKGNINSKNIKNISQERQSKGNTNINSKSADLKNEEVVDSDKAAIDKLKELGIEAYVEKFKKASEVIKSHQFLKDEQKELVDLLLFVKGKLDLKFIKYSAINGGISINFN